MDYYYKVRFNTFTGTIDVYCKGSSDSTTYSLTYTDPSPTTSGSYISITKAHGLTPYPDIQCNDLEIKQFISRIYDNFDDGNIDGWAVSSIDRSYGTWAVNSCLHQSDNGHLETNIYKYIEQRGTVQYTWSTFDAEVLEGISNPLISNGDGMYFMASEGTSENRGDSYLVWHNSSDDIHLLKYLDDVEVFDIPLGTSARTETNNYFVTYNAYTGEFSVKHNGNTIGTIDPDPIESGDYVSLRTYRTEVVFDDITVEMPRRIPQQISNRLNTYEFDDNSIVRNSRTVQTKGLRQIVAQNTLIPKHPISERRVAV